MTQSPASPGDLPAPEFHLGADALRFWVPTTGQDAVGASVSSSVLHYRFKGRLDGSDAVLVYEANRQAIDAAVLRRLAAGSREPVMLRENDLPLAPGSH